MTPAANSKAPTWKDELRRLRESLREWNAQEGESPESIYEATQHMVHLVSWNQLQVDNVWVTDSPATKFPISQSYAPCGFLLLTKRLARNDQGGHSDWGPMQIATPVIVGVGLIIIFAAFILWQRRLPNKIAHHYHQRRNQWVAKVERMFVPRRFRHRVLHSSDPVTLDDSLATPSVAANFPRVRQHRSESSDSQTPLTTTSYAFDYPPSPVVVKSPLQSPERRPWRWWHFFKSKPQVVTSEQPDLRWRIDGSDGSSTGHGQSIRDSEGGNQSRYISGLDAVNEDLETAEDSVICIGNNFSSIHSTPFGQHLEEERIRIVPPSQVATPEYTAPARTPVRILATSVPRSIPGAPIPKIPSPPRYSASPPTHTRQVSTEDLIRPANTDRYMLSPPPVPGARYGTPLMFHACQLSSESFLTVQSPMAAPSMY
ncbi:hypothetical protein PAXRUDRAFT_27114 [Paxillus rubicundulus Ve08.2h10]|uniref:Uncharacterized protein n=1 Tax=Paxillus rubicundulus Ve08.2h10 TaxID=930991 RepID=A0A0D0E2U9_9AGAM|nr:hypothetical protein PAXRUDRAFT_27114 [Paxillus rubicundulus Ve08.2h10]